MVKGIAINTGLRGNALAIDNMVKMTSIVKRLGIRKIGELVLCPRINRQTGCKRYVDFFLTWRYIPLSEL